MKTARPCGSHENIFMKREAFTLVEVLVVVGIIAILVSIILPVTRNVKRQAQATLCGSNIKQIADCMLTYEYEYERFPYGFANTATGTGVILKTPEGGYVTGQQYVPSGWWWFNYIEDLLKDKYTNKNVISCPSKNLNEIAMKYIIAMGNYGVNLSVCKRAGSSKLTPQFVGESLRLLNIGAAANTLLIADCGFGIINWRSACNNPPYKGGYTVEDDAYIPGMELNEKNKSRWSGKLSGMLYDAINGRHPNKTVNAGYVDGHIKREKADNFFVEKTVNGYENCSPLWQP